MKGNVYKSEEFKSELIDEGILERVLERSIKDYGLEWAPGTLEYIVNAVEMILSDCKTSVNADLRELNRNIGFVGIRNVALYFANVFANLVMMTAISEEASQVKCGHGLLALRRITAYGWGD